MYRPNGSILLPCNNRVPLTPNCLRILRMPLAEFVKVKGWLANPFAAYVYKNVCTQRTDRPSKMPLLSTG